jgi:hypothetical protein
MKIIAVLLLISCLAFTPVSAYQLLIEGPTEISLGQTIKVTGNSTFPSGTSFNLVLYQSQYTATEIERQTITLQEYNNKTFARTFSTRGLKGGMYKIEVQWDSDTGSKMSSDSITQLLVNVLDRSNEIAITSPLTQDLKDTLRIEGSIAKLGDAGVKIEVRGPEGPVFGPTWIATTKELKQGAGEFIKTININGAGDYDVSFSDARGYIGLVTFHVNAPTRVPTSAKTTILTHVTTRLTTTNIPTPTPTKSPLSPLLSLIALSLISGIVIISLTNKTR